MLPNPLSCLVCQKTIRSNPMSIKRLASSTGDAMLFRLYDIFGRVFRNGQLCPLCYGLVEEYDNYKQCLKNSESQIRLRSNLRRATSVINGKQSNNGESYNAKFASILEDEDGELCQKRRRSSDSGGRSFKKSRRDGSCANVELKNLKFASILDDEDLEYCQKQRQSSDTGKRSFKKSGRDGSCTKVNDCSNEFIYKSAEDEVIEVNEDEDGMINISEDDAKRVFVIEESAAGVPGSSQADSAQPEDSGVQSRSSTVTSNPNVSNTGTRGSVYRQPQEQTRRPQETPSTPVPQRRKECSGRGYSIKIGKVYRTAQLFKAAIGNLRRLPVNSHCMIKINGTQGPNSTKAFPYVRLDAVCASSGAEYSVNSCPWTVKAVITSKGYKVTEAVFEHEHHGSSLTEVPAASNEVTLTSSNSHV